MTTTNKNWPFLDSRDVAVFSSKRIVNDGDWVYYVTHDHEDGAWQFHPYSGLTPESEAAVVSLEEMIKLDDSLKLLSDLPCGWHAWRKTFDSEWERAPQGQ